MEIARLTWYDTAMRHGRILAMVCVLLCAVIDARADVIRLKNGRSVRGIIRNDEGTDIVISIPGGALTFPKNAVENVERSSLDQNRQQRMQWAAESARADQERENAGKSAGIAFPDTPNRIYIGAVLNRKVPVTFLLDTGAPYVIIRKGLARRLDISLEDGSIIDVSLAGTTVKAIQTTLSSVNVGGYQGRDVPALVLLQDTGLTDIKDGLLGLSFLNRYNFKIDYASRLLILEEKKGK